MIVERLQLLDFRRTVHFRSRALDVFQVLPASGIRTENRRDERKRPPYAIRLHLAQRVGEQRMPVAIAPVNGEVRPVARQLAFQPSDKRASLIVNGTLAAEVVIMLGDGQDPLPRNVAAAQNVL